MIFLSEVNQLSDDLKVGDLRCAMIWPGEVVQLDDLAELLALRCVDDLKLSANEVLHETLTRDEDDLHLLVVLLELETLSYF